MRLSDRPGLAYTRPRDQEGGCSASTKLKEPLGEGSGRVGFAHKVSSKRARFETAPETGPPQRERIRSCQQSSTEPLGLRARTGGSRFEGPMNPIAPDATARGDAPG